MVPHLYEEMRAIDTALEHLVASGSKTVIVDILARDKGTLKILPSGKYESHSVLLYKDPAVSDVYIIDPNNSKYSWHIANSEVQLLVRAKGFARIVAYDKILQIYTPAEDTGPAPGQYRDCIDISVKLAFGFNLSSKSVVITNLATHPIVTAVSNLPSVDKEFKDFGFSVRVKQSSDISVVTRFNNVKHLIDKKIKMIGEWSTDFADRALDTYKLSLSHADDHHLCLPELLIFNQSLTGEFTALLQQADLDV